MRDAWGPYVAWTADMKPDSAVREVLDAVLSQGRVRYALDLGCGGGRHLELFRRRGVPCTGVDSSPACSRLPLAGIVVADVTEPLPFDSGSADFVLLWGLFLHLPCDCHQALFEELHRVLVPGGTLLLDILRPDDFRNARGTPIAPNYNRSPFIEGVTDLFCSERYVIAMASRFDLVETRDLSHTRGHDRVSQACLWFQR